MMELKLAAQRALNLMDLTLLNDNDTDEQVKILCHQAKPPEEIQLRYVFILDLFHWHVRF